MPKVYTNIKDVAMKLDELSDVISLCGDDITGKVADVIIEEIRNNYSAFLSSIPDDPQNRGDTSMNKQRLETGKYRVDISGDQVIYDEFGTGNEGKSSPHKEKSKYDLDPYLSGSTIRYDKNGLPYWSFNYKRTYGVPAGMFIYHAQMDVAEKYASTIAAKELLNSVKKWSKK